MRHSSVTHALLIFTSGTRLKHFSPFFLTLISIVHTLCRRINKFRPVKGCMEVKPDYQWQLLPGENLLEALASRPRDVAPAIYQVSVSHAKPVYVK